MIPTESPIILLNNQKIISQLRHRLIQLEVLEKTTSTNDYLKTLTRKSKQISICIAEAQTQGKGRLNREWYSPFGENIYLSMLYPFAKSTELTGLSLIVGLAICNTIECIVQLKNHSLKVKWPNDVYLNNAKLAGTLIEIQSHDCYQVIIGVGINVNMSNASQNNIQQPWTSLINITEQHQDRNILCAALINTLIDYLQRFSLSGLSSFRDEWKIRDYLNNSAVTVISGNKQHAGTCVGINAQGCLLLETLNKNILIIPSGDASLLKCD